jgi:PHD/YefM family antitoxin component YafN of YafNO toxin-antitoxin module
LEARSIGSYSLRLYSTQHAQAGDDTTFFLSGVVHPRDGTVEKVLLVDLDKEGHPSLVVTIRSAGSGGYLSADAYSVDKDRIELRASVSGLPANADPVAALRSALQSSKPR